MKRALSTLLCAAMLSGGGCSLNPRPWTGGERAALAAALACTAADAATTLYAREALGLREMNPLMQDYSVAVAVQAVGLALIWWLAEQGDQRTPAWLGYGAARCGFAVWNGVQIGGAR